MVRIGMCVACQYGRHEEHHRVIQSVPEGMLGGAVCGCQGECQGKPTNAVQHQIDMLRPPEQEEPMDQSAIPVIVTGRWTKDRYVALCDDDKCPWKHVTERYTQVANRVDEHVASTGHGVTIHREAKCAVTLGRADA